MYVTHFPKAPGRMSGMTLSDMSTLSNIQNCNALRILRRRKSEHRQRHKSERQRPSETQMRRHRGRLLFQNCPQVSRRSNTHGVRHLSRKSAILERLLGRQKHQANIKRALWLPYFFSHVSFLTMDR